MPLGLVLRLRTQGISWSCQEVHHWANAFSSTANFVIFDSREREIGEKSRGVICSSNPVKTIREQKKVPGDRTLMTII